MLKKNQLLRSNKNAKSFILNLKTKSALFIEKLAVKRKLMQATGFIVLNRILV